MSSKKGQNSILLLTTLGVYIGLLMAGATPGVLAQQAALTRNFELSEEFEVKDDLDKDPEDEFADSDEEINLRSIEIVVSSYLSRVLNLDGDREIASNGYAVTRLRGASRENNTQDAAEFIAADVQNSSNFTCKRFPRAGL